MADGRGMQQGEGGGEKGRTEERIGKMRKISRFVYIFGEKMQKNCCKVKKSGANALTKNIVGGKI